MPELGLVQLDKARAMPGNPRTGHRVGSLVASLRRYGFGQPVTINTTTGHVIAGNGRIQALRKMKAAGEPPPEGITTRGKSWFVPAYFGTWSTAAEAEAALALNGGADGSLEGELDASAVAQILEQADQAAREALGLSAAQAEQILLDFSTPTVAPQINLDGLERSAGAVRNSETSTIHLVLPLDLAEEARAALRLGTTAEDLIRWGLHGKPKRKGRAATTAKAQPQTPRRKDRQGCAVDLARWPNNLSYLRRSDPARYRHLIAETGLGLQILMIAYDLTRAGAEALVDRDGWDRLIEAGAFDRIPKARSGRR